MRLTAVTLFPPFRPSLIKRTKKHRLIVVEMTSDIEKTPGLNAGAQNPVRTSSRIAERNNKKRKYTTLTAKEKPKR